jgi:hypothetical protein
MAVLLVTYDLSKPGQDYADLLKYLKGFSWARLSESSYAIVTDQSPESIATAARNHMDANDTVYVIHLKRPYAGFGPTLVNDWLEKHLPY